MRPRLAGDGLPQGSRKKSKKTPTQKTHKHEGRPPSPSFECTCFDCTTHPGTHPQTGLPSRGCWLSKKEFDAHSRAHRERGVADHLLASLDPPQLQLPVPEFGFLPRPLHRTLEPSSSRAPEVIHGSHPDPVNRDISRDLVLGQEIQAFYDHLRRTEDVIAGQAVVFDSPPHKDTKVDITLLDAEDIIQLCSLNPAVHSNSQIIGFQEYLAAVKKWLTLNPTKSISNVNLRLRVTTLQRRVNSEAAKLQKVLLEQWLHQENIVKLTYAFDSTRYYTQSFLSLPPVILASYLLVTILHLICGLSMSHCSFVLGCLRLIVQVSMESSTSIFTPHVKRAMAEDVRTVIDILDVNPRSTAYVSCPSCCFLYWFDPEKPQSYPDHCSNKELGHDVCGAKLKRIRKHQMRSTHVPVREYHYQSMSDYLARLYAREDLQDYLYTDPTTHQYRRPDGVWDIWEAPVLRDFLGPDGRTPFIKPPDKEGRLVFSLNMDGFNPYGTKQSGKKVTVGAIYMVCLNLPPAIRYDIENMYLVGVIPGPQAPSLHQINYYLKPLVDELLALWTTGVYLSRTRRCLTGLLVRCAMIPLVCDLPAARQMSGFAPHRAHQFCSVCTLSWDRIHDLNFKEWVPRDHTSHRIAAESWRDAATLAEREGCYRQNGLRWSELLRLPYWDPSRYTVIDSMHAFYLRLFQHHCREVWGMDITVEDGDGITFDISANHPTEDEMKRAQETLRSGSKTVLKQLRSAVVQELCRSLELGLHGAKPVLVERLLQYRIRQGWFLESGKPVIPGMDVAADVPDTSILVNPEIQTYLTPGGDVPKNLTIRTTHDVDDHYINATKSIIEKLLKGDLVTLFVHKVFPKIEMSTVNAKRLVVHDLRDFIQKQRKDDGLIDEKGLPLSGIQSKTKTKKTRVLGRDVLRAVQEDMKNLTFPSWVAKAPAHAGEKKWGKFTADQWRSFCTEILPVTLVRLWGPMGHDSSERRRLDNFMHLVSAVKLATMRSITPIRIQQYEYHMHRYLETLLELYPNTKITPYQHLALHYGPFLERFGPGHAWRCFSFERYNYVMQQLPTNRIFGELEKTMFRKFCSAQNIRALFSINSIPDVLHPLIDLYKKTFGNDARGTRLRDIMAHDERFKLREERVTWTDKEMSALDPYVFQLLNRWLKEHDDDSLDNEQIDRRVFRRSRVQRVGQDFATAKTSIGDSHIIIQDPSNPLDWHAGSIVEIFSHTREQTDGSLVTQTFAAVATYLPLSPRDVLEDHYRQYPVIGARLFYNRFGEELQLVELNTIKCHFGAYVTKSSTNEELLLTLPLDKD